MNRIKVRVVEDSVSKDGNRLTTIHMRYPLIIHAELMTHRVFSRNARSSRAVPVKTMLEEVMNEPFIPWHWGKNQKGMQASEECNEQVGLYVGGGDTEFFEKMTREDAWLKARDHAVEIASAFSDAGYHKQIANRLLEPFMYIDTLVSSTDWDNFFYLRDHTDAEPHIHDLARATIDEYNSSIPNLLSNGTWHLPYVTQEEKETLGMEICKQLSVVRCARISYKPFDGKADIASEIERYEKLVVSKPMHASPTEHQATPDIWIKWDTTAEYAKNVEKYGWSQKSFHGNFDGWIQFRKLLQGEYKKQMPYGGKTR